MKNTITVTSKGQTTLPAPIRRKLGLEKTGGVLQFNFDEGKGELTIIKPVSIEGLSERISRLIKPSTTPLVNIDEYYQKNRQEKD